MKKSDLDFEFMYMRTLVRHERGTLTIIMVLLGLLIIGMLLIWIWCLMSSRRFATPSIYQSKSVELRWGPYAK